MRTVELFAGIGGFRIAADLRGIRTVWGNDICPKACAVYRSHYGLAGIAEGNIIEAKDRIPSHDLLTAGFPCQPFSSAGKKEGIRDPRGTLFQIIIEVLRRHTPKYFILENVKRLLTMEQGFHFATILSSLAELNYDIEWRLLNAVDFGLPQNRQRIFLLGVHQEPSFNGYNTNSPSIRFATLGDLSELTAHEVDTLRDISSWRPIEKHGKKFPSWGLVSHGRFFGANLNNFSRKSPLVTLRTVLQHNAPSEFDFTETTLQWIGQNTPVNRFVHGVEILSNQYGGARMGYTIFGVNGVAPTLTSTTSRHYERYKVGDSYRRLTNIEYARIQGFPDDYCAAASVYDQYALLGNAVPPPMVGWVMDRIPERGIPRDSVPRDHWQVDMFDHVYQGRA